MTHASNSEVRYSIHIDENQTGEKRFGTWIVDERGYMSHKGYYHISPDMLNKRDLILHLGGKKWIDWNSFIPAYFQALYNAGRTHCHQCVHYNFYNKKFL